MTTAARRDRVMFVDETHRVTPIELFFDLIFVYAITQVTALMAAEFTPHGMVRGLLMLALLWWCWGSYAWLCNAVRADEGIVRPVLLGVMTLMFIVSLTIPEAFNDLPGGLSGPLVFAICYTIVRVLHLAIFLVVAAGDPALRRKLLVAAVPWTAGVALLFGAAFTHGITQTGLWALALLIDYGGTLVIGAEGWVINSATHFAERHGLMIIIAIGESIVAIGVGVTALPISWPIVVGAVLGIALATTLWWSYFDVAALVAERTLHRADPALRVRLARDSFTFLHLPMVAGIVLMALGLKKTFELVGDVAHHHLTDPLKPLGVIALYGGVALYLAAHVAFRLRNVRSLNKQRVVVVAVILLLIPLAVRLPALMGLALLTGLMVAVIGYEVVRFGEVRRAVRRSGAVMTS